MNSDIVKKTINKLCLSSGMSNKEFVKSVEKAIDDSGKDIDYPAESTINRWYNGKIMPNEKWLPFIATALGKTEEELNADCTVSYEELINDISMRLSASEDEKESIRRLVNLNGTGTMLIGLMLATIDIILLDISFWHFTPLYYVAIVLLLILYLIFNKFFPETRNNKGLGNKVKNNVDNFRYVIALSKEKTIMSKIESLYYSCFFIMAFLPVIEFTFYRGSFKATSVIYAIIAISMIVNGIKNR